MSEEKRLMIENDLCMNKSKAQVIKLYLDLLDDDIKQKEVLDDIKENLKNTDFEYLRLTNNHCLADYLERLLELLEEIE